MRISYLCSLLFCLTLFVPVYLQAQEVEWLEGAYASGNAFVRGQDNAINKNGEMYSAGQVNSQANQINYLSLNTPIQSSQNNNGYILKKNNQGTGQWLEVIENGVVNSITLEDEEYVYVTGKLTGDAYFNGGNDTLQKISTANLELFIAKFDQNNGNLIWATRPLYNGGPITNTNSSGKTILFHKGHIYLGGYYTDSIALDSNIGFNDNGEGGPFIAKYDTSGQPLWGNFTDNTGGSGGSSSSHTVNSLNLKNDKIITTGTISNSSSFGLN